MKMWPLALGFEAGAHPPLRDGLAADAHERLVDDVLEGPLGCFESKVVVRWDHRSGGYQTRGEADTVWRLDHRVWRLDRREVVSADRDSLDVVVAPMLIGTAIQADLAWPMTRQRRMEWPQPVATLPVRLFGEVNTVSIDQLADGSKRVVESFSWDGWKRVDGRRSVTFGAGMSARAVSLDATDRWPNGCRVRSVGEAVLGQRGLPVSEAWTFAGSCALRGWTGEWRFEFGEWRRCKFSGPARERDL